MNGIKIAVGLATVALLVVIALTIWHLSAVLRKKIGQAVDDIHWLRNKVEALDVKVEGKIDAVSDAFSGVEQCLSNGGTMFSCLTAKPKPADDKKKFISSMY